MNIGATTFRGLKVYKFKFYNTKIQKCKGGRWRYKLVVSVKITKSKIQRYKSLGVVVVATDL